MILRLIPRRFSSDCAAAIMTAQQAHAIIVLGIAMLDIALAVTLGIDSLVAFARLVRPELTVVLRIPSAIVLPAPIVNHVIALLDALSATLDIGKTMVAVLHVMLVHLMMGVAIHVLVNVMRIVRRAMPPLAARSVKLTLPLLMTIVFHMRVDGLML